jgi:hypothetical protein
VKYVPKTLSELANSAFISYIKFFVMVSLKIYMYYADLYKDIFIINEYAKYFQFAESEFNTFGYQVFVLLIFSVAFPMVINFLFIMTEKWITSRTVKIVIIMLFPLTPAIAIYFSVKLIFLKQRTKLLYKNDQKNSEFKTVKASQQLAKYDTMYCQWTTFLASLRSNENVIEHYLQTLVLIVLIGLKFTKTNTVNGFQELLAGGDNSFLLITSAAWSTISIILGYLHKLVVQKEHYVPKVGKLLQFSFAVLSMICRVSAIVIFLAPTLGLLNLLTHFESGKLLFKNNSILMQETQYENGTFGFIKKEWKAFENYDELTGLKLDSCYVALLFMILLHFVMVWLVKVHFAREFKSRSNLLKKCFHVLQQGQLH